MSTLQHARGCLVDCEGSHFNGMLPDSFDGTIRRRKASTPTSYPLEAHSSVSASSSSDDAYPSGPLIRSKEISTEDLPYLQDRGRPLIRSPLLVSARRRVLSPASATQRRERTFPTMKQLTDDPEEDHSMPETSTRATLIRPRTIFEPKPARKRATAVDTQQCLAPALSKLLAGEPSTLGVWPLESSEDDSELSNDSLPERHQESVLDDEPIRPLVEGYRDTFALLKRHRRRRPSRSSSLLGPNKQSQQGLPLLLLQRLAMAIDHSTYLALRLTSSLWCAGITRARPLVFPAVYRLPTEIIQEIYRYLHPVDFNAARHTCRAWMMASMNNTLLQVMLQRGGWWGAAEPRITKLIQEHPDMPPASAIRWALHSSLAQECALSANWTGNGIIEFEIAQEEPNVPAYSVDACKCLHGSSTSPFERKAEGASEDVPPLDSVPSPYSVVSILDFSEFGELQPFLQQSQSRSGGTEVQYDSQVHLSASKCGRFLLVCDNHRVFVYELCRDAVVRFVACMSCPRRVLSVSMDTSCGRYAVAMLLEGRAGLVGHVAIHNGSDPTSGFDTPDSAGSPPPLRQETGYRRVFWNVCTEEDPPLSVAISPQRSFVAFGSATGIEVHWIEANHQNVSRWFPLTAPSNHLYFLPSRKKLTSPERIRLVSSAAINSMSNGGMDGTLTGPADEHRDYNAWSSEYLFGRWISRARDGHDSYHAIPLSDGEHVLFTDPRTQSLCLGGDAPIGGATERERRIIFSGPKGISPSVYAAGSDLTTGVRVFAGYGDELWFFSVPIDVFHCGTSGLNERWTATYCTENVHDTRSCSPEGGFADDYIRRSSTRSSSPAPMIHSPSTFPIAMRAPRHKRGVWPVRLSGQRLGTIPKLLDVAVDSRPESLTLWAFSASGITKAWQIRARPMQRLPHVVVNRCGNIAHTACLSPTHEPIMPFSPEAHDDNTCKAEDASVEVARGLGTVSPSLYSFDEPTTTEPFPIFDLDGDVIMRDAPSISYTVGEAEDMDGNQSDREGAINEYEVEEEEQAHFSDTADGAGGSDISTRPSTRLMLCEIHDGGGAVCRGWMVPQGESSGLVLQWQGNEWSASEERASG